MLLVAVGLLLILASVWVLSNPNSTNPESEAIVERIGKDIPRTKDGYIDYQTLLNQKGSNTPAGENAAIDFLKILGPLDDRVDELTKVWNQLQPDQPVPSGPFLADSQQLCDNVKVAWLDEEHPKIKEILDTNSELLDRASAELQEFVEDGADEPDSDDIMIRVGDVSATTNRK